MLEKEPIVRVSYIFSTSSGETHVLNGYKKLYGCNKVENFVKRFRTTFSFCAGATTIFRYKFTK